jgi:hypothetical protein
MFGMGLMLGLDTLVAQAYGRKDHDECHRWLAQGVYLACIAAVPIMVGIGWRAFSLALRNCGGSGGAGERIHERVAVGHAAAAALRRRRGATCRAWARCA